MKIADEDRVKYLPTVVEPDVLAVLLEELSKEWDDIVAAMKLMWGFRGGNMVVLSRIHARQQRAGESVGMYARAHKHLQGLLVDDLESKPLLHLAAFRLGLRPEARLFLLGKSGLDTMDLLVALVGEWEAEQSIAPVMPATAPTHAEPQVAFIKAFTKPTQPAFARGRGRGRGQRSDGCFVCGLTGHQARDCKHKAVPGSARVALFESSSQYARQHHSSQHQQRKLIEKTVLGSTTNKGFLRPLVLVRMQDGQLWSALADTGASVSCISGTEARRLRVSTEISPIVLRGADHTTMTHAGKCCLPVMINKVTKMQDFFVVNDLPMDVLLGRDAIASWGITIISSGQVIFTTTEDENSLLSQQLLTTTATNPDALMKTTKRIRNDPQVLNKCHFGDALPHLRSRVQQILLEFIDVFAEDGDDFGTANCEPLKIHLKRPLQGVVMTPHRLAWQHQQFLDDTIAKWLAASPPRIRESTSKVAVSVHVVPKDSAPGEPPQYRLVTNFKPINDFFESDNHPVGDAQRIFDEIGGDTKAFWKVDFANAFLQMPMDEDSKYLTSFVTHDAQYEFNNVPFGLKSAPAKLQRELNRVFRGLPRVYGFADDWLGAPTTDDQAVDGLRTFMERVRASGFLLKPSKCYFLFKNLTYMGRELTLTGYGPDLDSKNVLLNMRRPVNGKELEEYLGLARWYAPFCTNFAALSASLYALIKETQLRQHQRTAKSKGKRKSIAASIILPWGQVHQQAFESIHKAVTQALPLSHIRKNVPITIETDASRIGLAAVMKQDGKVVRILHRVLKPVERSMPITLLELNAVLFAVERWDHFLSGNRFSIVTDHKALTWLKSCKGSYGKLAEWAYKLEKYDYDISHRPGVDLGLADTISRTIATVTDAVSLVPDLSVFLAAQMQDQDSLALRNEILDKKPKALESFVIDWSELICKLDERYGYPVLKPVVPKKLIPKVLQACHEDVAHMSPAETARRAAASWWWKGLADDAMEFAKSCVPCQERKGPPRNRKIPLGALSSNKPNQLVSIDIMSGLPPSPEGWQYVLGMCDNFTKVLRLAPLKSKTAAETAAVFKRAWVDDLGKPDVLHSDQGTEFWGWDFRHMLADLTIKHSFTTDYHPAGDGQIERNFQTVAAMLATSIVGARDGWPGAMAKVQDAYNEARHAFTGYPPNFLFSGKENRNVLTSNLVVQPAPTIASQQERQRQLAHARQTVQQKVHNKLKRLEKYNKTLKVSFEKGDLVWVKIQATMEALHSKVNRPYVLCKVLSKKNMINYVIQQIGGTLAGTVNVKNMKKYFPKKSETPSIPVPTRPNLMHDSPSTSSVPLTQLIPPEVQSVNIPPVVPVIPVVPLESPEAVIQPQDVLVQPVANNQQVEIATQPTQELPKTSTVGRLNAQAKVRPTASPARVTTPAVVVTRTRTREIKLPARYQDTD